MNASLTAGDWIAIVPVKVRDLAKTRLRPSLEPWRAELAGAFALDTLAAICACPSIASVLVVTDDSALAEQAADPKLSSVADPAPGDLNLAVAEGVRVARASGSHLVVLTGDLPALRPYELADALAAARQHEYAVVSDVEGTGTTMLSATSPDVLRPQFGPDSFARHRAGGAIALDDDRWPGLRRDVDLPEQLDAAARLELGPRTAALLGRIALA